MSMTLREYQELAGRTSGNRKVVPDDEFAPLMPKGGLRERRAVVACMGLAGETGELIDYLKKCVAHGHDYDPALARDEIGDVLWYLAELATSLGLKLDEAAERNVEKLKRRYPDGFSEERSRNRDAA